MTFRHFWYVRSPFAIEVLRRQAGPTIMSALFSRLNIQMLQKPTTRKPRPAGDNERGAGRVALLSVGTIAPDSTAFRFGFSSEEERTALIRLGAVGVKC